MTSQEVIDMTIKPLSVDLNIKLNNNQLIIATNWSSIDNSALTANQLQH